MHRPRFIIDKLVLTLAVLLFVSSCIGQTESKARWAHLFSSGPIERVVSINNDTQLASVGSDQCLRIWNAQTGQLLRVFSDPFEPTSLIAADPTGAFLAVGGGFSNPIRIYDQRTWSLAHIIPGTSGSTDSCLRFSPNGQTLAVGTFIHSVRTYSTTNWQQLAFINGHTSAVVDIQYSPDGQFLVSSGDTRVIVRNPTTLAAIRILAGSRTGQFTSDSTAIIMGTTGAVVRRYDYASTSIQFNINLASSGGYRFFPRQNLILVLRSTQYDLYDATSGAFLRTIQIPSGYSLTGATGSSANMIVLAFSTGGRSLVRTYDISNGQIVREFATDDFFSEVSVSRDESVITVGQAGGGFQRFNRLTGLSEGSFVANRGSFFFGSSTYVLANNFPNQLVNATNGQIIRSLPSSYHDFLDVSPAGYEYAYSSGLDIRIANPFDDTFTVIPNASGGFALFHPSGKTILVRNSASAFRLVDRSTLTTIWSNTPFTGNIYKGEFTRDGSYAVITKSDGTVYVIRSADGVLVSSFTALHTDFSLSLDGRHMATVIGSPETSEADFVKIYDVFTGQLVHTVTDIPSPHAVEYTQTGAGIYVAGRACGVIANPIITRQGSGDLGGTSDG